MNNKTVIILRGISGSGKTTFAEAIADNRTAICCADDYFVDANGNYNFDPEKLNDAHEFCKERFKKVCRDEGIDKIIVANTNTSDWEFNWYKKVADDFRFRTFFIIIENRHGNFDIHNVPENVLEKQKKRLLNSIKL
jgi:predicted kinase